jgi:hypothetical protein
LSACAFQYSQPFATKRQGWLAAWEGLSLGFFAGKSFLDASIWHKPNHCDQYV